MRIMQPLTRDVGIFIVLTVKIVVQFAVATDVYLSALFAKPCTFSLVKIKHVKGSVRVHTRLHDLTPDVVGLHCLDSEERRPKLSSTITLCDNVYLSSHQWSRKLKHVKRRGRCTALHLLPQVKILIQFAVATDAYFVSNMVTPCTSIATRS